MFPVRAEKSLLLCTFSLFLVFAAMIVLMRLDIWRRNNGWWGRKFSLSRRFLCWITREKKMFHQKSRRGLGDSVRNATTSPCRQLKTSSRVTAVAASNNRYSVHELFLCEMAAQSCFFFFCIFQVRNAPTGLFTIHTSHITGHSVTPLLFIRRKGSLVSLAPDIHDSLRNLFKTKIKTCRWTIVLFLFKRKILLWKHRRCPA
jgi:hypothetical protein